MEELLEHNDIELYDVKNDPEEMNNLALDPENNEALIMEMNEKLKELGCITISGRIDRKFFSEKFYASKNQN